jgi:hypothetical protein
MVVEWHALNAPKITALNVQRLHLLGDLLCGRRLPVQKELGTFTALYKMSLNNDILLSFRPLQFYLDEAVRIALLHKSTELRGTTKNLSRLYERIYTQQERVTHMWWPIQAQA